MTPAPRDPAVPAVPAVQRRRVAGSRPRRSVAPAADARRAPATPGSAPAPAPAAAPAPPAAAADHDREPGGSGRTPWWAGRPALVALAVLTVLAVAAVVALAVLDRRAQQVSDARGAAVEAARAHAETVLSYDHTTLDDDFAAALAVSTGEFAEQYRSTSEGAVRDTATETRAVVEAESVAAGVVSATPDQVVVLVFVNQTTTSTRADTAQTDLNRVRMTMVREGGDWLVAGVDAL